jgi:hypothetical protein
MKTSNQFRNPRFHQNKSNNHHHKRKYHDQSNYSNSFHEHKKSNVDESLRDPWVPLIQNLVSQGYLPVEEAGKDFSFSCR